MTVKRQAKIDFSNECECLVDYSELEKAILWYQQKPTLGRKKIYLHGLYPAVSIHGQELIEKAYRDSENSGKNYEAYVKFVEKLEEINNEKHN